MSALTTLKTVLTALQAIASAVGKFFTWLSLKRAHESGVAESDARHAQAALEADERMRRIAENPPSDDELDIRLEGGTA